MSEMHGLTHPYSRDYYEIDESGGVKVTSRDGSRVGFFAADGHWLDGDRFEADPHLCGWVSAPRKVHRAATPSST
jgi:hypothetical protein